MSRQPPEIETLNETISSGETANSDGDRLPASWSDAGAGTAPATVMAPVQWFGADMTADEPPYDRPCLARRGVIRGPGSRFEHFCAVCGAWGAFGLGVTAEEPGRWYCLRHRATGSSRSDRSGSLHVVRARLHAARHRRPRPALLPLGLPPGLRCCRAPLGGRGDRRWHADLGLASERGSRNARCFQGPSRPPRYPSLRNPPL